MADSQRFIDRYTSALPSPHCDHCGFTLAGLAERGLCPECGTAFEPATTSIPRQRRLLRLAGYLALPLVIATVSTVATGVFATSRREGVVLGMMLFVPAPLSIAWFGWRAGRGTTLVFTRCMPRRRAESALCVALYGFCQFVSFVTMFVGLVGAGLIVVVGFMVADGLDA